MNIARTILTAAVAVAAFSAPLIAQNAEFELPEHCKTASVTGGMDHSAMGHGSMQGNQTGGMMGMEGVDLDTMPAHVQENMRRMMISMLAMQEGMMNEDANVAFACGMVAHHQGAIDMAQVLLEYGDDEQMIELAEVIIAAQVDEIEQMIAWLTENAN